MNMKRLFKTISIVLLIMCPIEVLKGEVIYSSVLINEVYYNLLSDGTAEVTNQTGGRNRYEDDHSYPKKVVIMPSVLYKGDRYIVTVIGENAFSYSKLSEIHMPDCITDIKRRAFYRCELLQAITLPANLKNIGILAFSNCYNLTDIKLPDKLVYIDDYAFRDCKNLKKINFPESIKNIGYEIFDGTGLDKPIFNSHLFAFLPSKYTQYDIPNGIEVIGAFAFAHCPNLDSVTIPSSVKNIERCAFGSFDGRGCPIRSIVIPDGVRTIGVAAFSHCMELTYVFIGNNVTTLLRDAFLGCKNIKTIKMGNNIKNIGSGAFCCCSSLKTLNLTNSIDTIGSNAFRGCTNLNYMTIPNEVKVIGRDAFTGLSYVIYSGTADGAPWGAGAVCP